MKQNYGWRKDLVHEDSRDFLFSAPRKLVEKLPEEVDWRKFDAPIRNQGNSGSCTGFSSAGSHQFLQIKEDPKTVFAPSGYFAYYNARVTEGSVNQDAGATIRDVVHGMVKQGITSEALWPSIDPQKVTVRPPVSAYQEAEKHQVLKYQSVPQTLEMMMACIAARYSMQFGIILHRSFESSQTAKTGIVKMPGWFDSKVGGHAMRAVGYSTKNKWFIVPNTWGTSWGDKGYCYIPFNYLLNPKLCSDIWQIMLVEEEV